MSVELAESEQIGQREIAPLAHERVDHRGHVADREMPHVARGIVQPARIHVHLVEEENRSEIGRRERPPAVPRLGAGEERHDVAAHEERALLQLTDGHFETRHGALSCGGAAGMALAWLSPFHATGWSVPPATRFPPQAL